MAKFFIDRPIFAWVIALFIIVMGSVATATVHRAHVPILIVRPASLREEREASAELAGTA